MRIIKLNATTSTNLFLKELSVETLLENFTVVVTQNQTSGRGQMDTVWHSEPNKNLMFSVYVKFENLKITNQTYLNFSVALAMHQMLNALKIPSLAVKWPNDILSDKKKLCGILIENVLKGNLIHASIIGIGLNVNQENFPEHLPNAASLKSICKRAFNTEELLQKFLVFLQVNIEMLNLGAFEELESAYLRILYKKNIPSMFRNTQNVLFLGKIIGVNTKTGKLQIELNDETVKEFALKEVSFA